MSVNLTLLKSVLYCDVTDSKYDEVLTELSQMITARMIAYLDNSKIDPDNPPLELRSACMRQVAYEWRQRQTPGLEMINYHDGSTKKMQITEWLKDVKSVLDRHRRLTVTSPDW